ncbi:hypothetical protein [Methanobacterium sp.]
MIFDGPVKFADQKIIAAKHIVFAACKKPMVFAVANRRFANIENVIS